MRIQEEYKKSGFFWLPNQEKAAVPGILTIKDGGKTELEILGVFDDDFESTSDNQNIDRIIGQIEDDGLVTLEKAFFTEDARMSCKLGLIAKSKLLVDIVLNGIAYNEGEDATFNSFSFSVDCLDEWVGITGIKVDTNWEKRTATINYIPLNILSFSLNNGMILEIFFQYSIPSQSLTEAKITQKASFRIKSETPKPLSDFMILANYLTKFICFAADDTVSMADVVVTSNEVRDDIGDGRSRALPIKVYYESLSYAKDIPNKTAWNMLFNFPQIQNNFENIINKWLEAYETISPAINLYFSTKEGAQRYLDGKFLALAQGLETYHRRTSDEKLMEEKDFKQLKDKILEHCPDENRDWLQGRLMHGNEINLRKRLVKIIEPFKDYLGSSKTRKKLINNITDTRNYLTHYSKDLELKAVTEIELYKLCMQLEIIFQLHFLKILGFSDEEIKSIVENCFPLKNKMKYVETST